MTYTYLLESQVGVANGAAELDSSGLIPDAQIDNILASAFASGSAINGQALTANGSGGASWVATSGGAQGLDPFLLMGT